MSENTKTARPISALRTRMIEDMNVRNFVPDTQREYIRAVKKLAAFLKRSPDTASAEDLRAFQVHLTETGTRPPTHNDDHGPALLLQRDRRQAGNDAIVGLRL